MLRTIIDIPQGHFYRDLVNGAVRISVEETGKGDLLCYEAYGGRFFRSSEKAVRKAVDTFVKNYERACRMQDEDPAHMYVEVFNFNDLYSLLGIVPSHFGEHWGYTNAEDYRVNLRFDITLVDQLTESYFERIREPVLVIELNYDCYPMESYMEVS